MKAIVLAKAIARDMLRERSSPLPLWCTDAVAEDLTEGNPILRVLSHYCGVERHGLPFDGSPFTIAGVPGLALRALALTSKAAPYSPHRERGEPGDNIGVTVSDPARGRSLLYAPGLAEITPAVFDAMVADAMYDASEGSYSGAHISLQTRTGTNQYHGQAYEYHQTDAWNAAPYFFNQDDTLRSLGKTVPELKRNSFGAFLCCPDP